jgi:4-hydroxy-tetrahydrodipicolinate reductase
VRIKVAHVGLGPIGAAIVRQVAIRKGLVAVAGVDTDPAKAGLDLGDACQVGRRLKVAITDDVGRAVRTTRPDVAIVATSSSLRTVLPVMETLLKLKVPIVSTTEELAYPTRGHAASARRIDALAKRARVAVLGTGVNPGFVMDALPITLTAVCERVDAIKVDRVQDARIRRFPFQKKIGAGLLTSEFEARAADGSVRHVGLAESIAMIADALGWKLDRVTEEITPKVAERDVSSAFMNVTAGAVAGLVQDGIGYRRGKPIITLHMEAYLGAPHSYDAIEISGSPPIKMRIEGGVHGDIATAAIVANSIPRILASPPGLRTMRDLALPSFYR